jgi:hypothetical protein
VVKTLRRAGEYFSQESQSQTSTRRLRQYLPAPHDIVKQWVEKAVHRTAFFCC